MAGALLFWGWQTGLLTTGLAMAVALEASYFTVARWEFKETDLNRICDLCWLLVLGAVVVLASTEDRVSFIFKFMQGLPVCFFPIILAQAYGSQEVMPVSAFYWLLRRGRAGAGGFHVAFPYFTVCLIGASASTQANEFFYMGMALLILLALASLRPQHVSLLLWILLATLVVSAGQMGHQRLRKLQNTFEAALGTWVSELLQQTPNMNERRTRMGHLGRLPQSRKVLLRVRVPAGQIPPSLLREAVFDIYTNQTWYARSNYNRPVSPLGAERSFVLLPLKPRSAETEISSYFESGKGPLALPHGVFEIDGLAAILRTNVFGVCSIEGDPGVVTIRARYGGGASLDAPPGPEDLLIPKSERATLELIAKKLKIPDLPERRKIRAVTGFFRSPPFVYSLTATRRPQRNRMTELAWFLTESHTGHCEYFATATVLLLREAGIPARYVTGFAVPESARHGDTYLVRERHEHAWVLAYHSDTQYWEQIDTTPSAWEEAETPSWWESVADFLSTMAFNYSKWHWSKTSFARAAEWILAPMGLYLIWRILSGQRRRLAKAAAAAQSEPSWPGLDSELFLIYQRLAGGKFARLPNESLAEWQTRLEASAVGRSTLRHIFQLHRRLRFDPRGLAAAERALLKREVESWLAEFAAMARPGETP
jgi:transglutaminase-like putative cysteine protease